MTPEQHDQMLAVLEELAGSRVLDTGHMTVAGRAIAQRHNEKHRSLHADAQKGGLLVLGMRESGMSWRQIYEATGIIQRTGDRWLKLYLEEGLTPRPDDELDARWQGRQE
jgi:hypothetical protein